MNEDRIVSQLVDLFATRGHDAYLGEPVTQLEHALQAASLAEAADAGSHLITAALLHDVGHVLDDETLAIGEAYLDGEDRRHEEIGRRWLDRHFTQAVADCARLHVAAKRYLCATNKNYFGRLSEASVRSLGQQGGPFSEDEVKAFEKEPFFEQAITVRCWDDLAKKMDKTTPPFEHFVPHLVASRT